MTINKLRLLLFALALLSCSANSAIISLMPNTGYPESYTHGAGAYVSEQWLDIDATCAGYDVGYVVTGSTSATGGDCTYGVANSTFSFSSGPTSLLADGEVSVSVEDASPIADIAARAGSIVDVDFAVDDSSSYKLSVMFVDNGHAGATDFESRIQLYEDGLLIEDISSNPTGLIVLQGAFQSGSVYRLTAGVADYGDTGFFPYSTGNGSGSFSMSLTLVPLPPAGYLFPFGLTVLYFFRKRSS